jgi:PsbP-like protein
MRLLIFFVTILFICTSTIAQTTTKSKADNTTQSWLSYKDSATGIVVKYPSNWTLKTTNPKSPIVLKAPLENDEDVFAENINYVIRPISQGQKVLLSDISKAIKSSIPNAVDEFKLDYEKKLQWMGTEALEFAYSGISKGENAGVKVKMLQRLTILKGNLYLATYSAENKKDDVSRADAMKIINVTTLKK